MPVELTRLLRVASASVDFPGEAQQSRFNDRERAQILDSVGRASRDELSRAEKLTDPGQRMSGSRRGWRASAAAPMWCAADNGFRLQLKEAIARRLGPAANSDRDPPAADSVSNVRAPPSDAAERRFAVLLIDAEYEDRVFRGEDISAEQQNMARVLAAANARGVPVFEVIWPGAYETSPVLGRLRQAGNWIRVEKDDQDAFVGTDLADELAARGITDLIVMGLFQNHCVRSTALSADRLGYRLHSCAGVVQGGDRFSPGDPEFHGWDGIPRAQIVARVDDLPLLVTRFG
jgi:hypothetical protein